MKTIIIPIVLLFSTPAFAGGDSIQTWWDNEYQQKVAPNQQKQHEARVDETCARKISYYQEKLEAIPDDVFFAWRLNYYYEKCGIDEKYINDSVD